MMPDTGTGAGVTIGDTSVDRYEFSPIENATIGRAAGRAKMFGVVNVIAGVAAVVCGASIALALHTAGARAVGLGILVAGLVPLLAALFYVRAGKALRDVVTTRGNDVALMMSALAQLRNAVRLEGVLTVLAFVGGLIVGAATAVTGNG